MDFDEPFTLGAGRTLIDKELTDRLLALSLKKQEELDIENNWQTNDYYTWGDPEIHDINAEHIKFVDRYLRKYQKSMGDWSGYKFSGWVNIKDGNFMHEPHNHGTVNLIINTYLQTPPNTVVTFINPDVGYNTIMEDPLQMNYIFKPKPGDVIITPGWWLHYTNPTGSKEKRISMSTNVTLY